MNKIVKNTLISLIPVAILWIIIKIFFSNQMGYGMAILPLIVISILLFIITFFISIKIMERK